MHILEMENIGPIFWNILDMAFYIMDCCGSVFEIFHDRAEIYNGILGFLLVLLHGMDPYINVPVHLGNRIFPQ